MSLRRDQLETIQHVREGRVIPRKMDWAEHVMRIPERDYYALLKIFPALDSKNAAEQKAAWEELFQSDFGRIYRVARTPSEVLRAPRSIIVK